jgi:hypothetical protein
MNTPAGRACTIGRASSLLFSFLFLLFLGLSQPHRVHHSFEQQPPAHAEDHEDGNSHDDGRSQPLKTDCIVFSFAKNCHFGSVQSGEILFVLLTRKAPEWRARAWNHAIDFTSFLPRAPPTTALPLLIEL